MSKRLQVTLDEAELCEIKKIARARNLSVAAWVREVLRSAQRSIAADRGEKLTAIRRAARHSFPTGDIAEILAPIERGYGRVAHRDPKLVTTKLNEAVKSVRGRRDAFTTEAARSTLERVDR
jgi:hypothetical protein